ncbi:MAG: anti-sigma factor antagonist [Clostridia bacterium]|nr:anti-sigma factor antagonist [Clostridia bacterium]
MRAISAPGAVLGIKITSRHQHNPNGRDHAAEGERKRSVSPRFLSHDWLSPDRISASSRKDLSASQSKRSGVSGAERSGKREVSVLLDYEKRNGTLCVRLSGELDHRRAGELRAELDGLIADPGVRRLVFDLSGLEFMDSSGIGMMIGRYKLMRRRGGSVAVMPGSRRMDRIMQLSGLYEIIEKLA